MSSLEKTRRELSLSLELLGKIEGVKSYVRRCRAEEAISSEEMVVIMRSTGDLEAVARSMIHDRERKHEQLGGVFALQPDKPTLFTRKLI